MVRHDNWPDLLSQYLKECKKKPFAWGEHDCILFAAKCIERLTGENLYHSYLIYDNEAGAHGVVSSNGGLSEIVKKHLGPGHRDIMKARRGDLVMMKMNGETIGVVDDSGENIACVSHDGLKRFPLKTAWRIWGY